MMVAPRDALEFGLTSDSVLRLFIATFCPRTDIYVENAAGVKREPITPDVLRKASAHRYPISTYMAYDAGKGIMRTHVGAIDFDRDDGMECADMVSGVLTEQGVKPLLFESRRGAHLWTLWGPDPQFLPPRAAIVIRALRNAVVLAGYHADDTKIEVFPHPLGNGDASVGALRLPGLPHHRTGVRYPGWTATGEKVEGVEKILLAFEVMPHEVLVKLAGPEPSIKQYGARGTQFYMAAPVRPEAAPSASEILAGLGIEARPGRTVRCPAHRDQHGSLTIFRDDRRVYCGAPSCVLHGDGHGVGSIALASMKF